MKTFNAHSVLVTTSDGKRHDTTELLNAMCPDQSWNRMVEFLISRGFVIRVRMGKIVRRLKVVNGFVVTELGF